MNFIYIYNKYIIYIHIHNNFITLYAIFFENVKKYKIHDETFKYSYISIFTNLLRTENEKKSVRPIYNHIN